MKNIESYIITEPMSALEIIKERIIPLVQEDYTRMRMGCWIDRNSGLSQCGTTACIAGWTVHVLGLYKNKNVIGSIAYYALSLVPPLLRTEFQSAFTRGDHFITEDGTEEQAEAVVDFLNDFCTKHEKKLRCWIIDPTSSGLGSDEVDPYKEEE